MAFLRSILEELMYLKIIAHGLKDLNICLFLLQQITESKLLCCTGVTDNRTRGKMGEEEVGFQWNLRLVNMLLFTGSDK